MSENNFLEDSGEQKRFFTSDRYIFLLSIAISLIFWFFIKLSDRYTESYMLKVDYKNIPVNMHLTSKVDTLLHINISSDGYKVLGNLINGKLREVVVDLKKCGYDKFAGNVYTVNIEELKNYLSGYLDVPEADITIAQPYLRFVLEKNAKKVVKLKVKTDFDFESQYGLYNIDIEPPEVKVFGPASLLDTLSAVYTQPLEKHNLSSDFSEQVKVENPYPALLNIVPANVNIVVDVEKYTEAVLDIPVDVSKQKVNIRTFPSKVRVFYHVALKDYNTIHANMFEVVPDLEGVDLKGTDKISLKLSRKPKLVSQVRMVPHEVEFLIVK
jgi:YbbR domain-containing protein